ncbi:hypothetical protein C8R45DRAFT_942534 [Mycena sanguinolenta]|nr:hypothetical protein C8R45DRAFT_948535 [Mycena sanguinolenta]KAJ6458701.1 hypothetical protein C8R45DRAFT_942534 [Mycena sanguinolenta]
MGTCGKKGKENQPLVDSTASPTSDSGQKLRKWAVWTYATVAMMLRVLLKHRAENENGWKGEVWNECSTVLKGTEAGSDRTGGPEKTAKMCTTRWVSEKAEYISFKTILGKSGFGYNAADHTVTAPDEVKGAQKKNS